MTFEDISRIFFELKKKLIYMIVIFGAASIISFPYMGEIIKKIEYDMFYKLNLPGNTDISVQLAGISGNISLISRELPDNPVIASNLSKISQELFNISHNLKVQNPSMVYLTPMEVLMLEFKMSLIIGVIITSPLIFYYGYRGLKGKLPNIVVANKYSIILVLLSAVGLFLLGATYSYFYMLPFFLSYIYQDALSLGINATFSIYEFIYFIVLTTVILGFSFELPLILTLLVRSGITSRRSLSYYRKHAYIIMLIIAAWVTPDPTMFSQVMMMLPFVVLYEVSLLLMRITGKTT
ncbi:MAG: twin-arginine translocase subunit TatC [Candidatus Methanoperedens sp.]|nr:twin-arginine translocase subunit TatC [Candidatus Methanoperedens sp.]MCE8428314.1 twin-arginine translocase subunit TatC [Candidatus Methanoperedens sp.]